MTEQFETHLFEYRHDGALWSLEVKATSAEDARERLLLAANGRHLGTLQMKIPVELGVFAKLICWWQNRRSNRV